MTNYARLPFSTLRIVIVTLNPPKTLLISIRYIEWISITYMDNFHEPRYLVLSQFITTARYLVFRNDITTHTAFWLTTICRILLHIALIPETGKYYALLKSQISSIFPFFYHRCYRYDLSWYLNVDDTRE